MFLVREIREVCLGFFKKNYKVILWKLTHEYNSNLLPLVIVTWQVILLLIYLIMDMTQSVCVTHRTSDKLFFLKKCKVYTTQNNHKGLINADKLMLIL